jgi:DNA-directed RNA polymerase specialized sigma24 family protein
LRREKGYAALAKLTAVQRRRYLLHVVKGLSTRKIAEMEGVEQRSVMDSLEWAEKKIKKFLGSEKK